MHHRGSHRRGTGDERRWNTRLSPMSPLRLWPYHPKPLEDESLSSWIGRVVVGNGTRPQTFFLVHKRLDVRPLDLDRSADDALLDLFATRTATPYDRVVATTFRSLIGTMIEAIPTRGNLPWAVNAIRYVSHWGGCGQQWCPACLADDVVPYYRLGWRLASSACCPRHGILLADRCHQCGMPASPLKHPEPVCHACGVDRREYPRVSGEATAIEYEALLGHIRRNAVVRLGEYGAVHPISYFRVVRHLLKILAFGPRALALREIVAHTYGGQSHLQYQPQRAVHVELESLCPQDRHALLGLAARLLVGWPFRFIGACLEARVTSNYAAKDLADPPFCIWDPIRAYLLDPRPPARPRGVFRSRRLDGRRLRKIAHP
ncbi:TniQ family protein [Azospirillum sp. sgz302134]